MGRLWLVLVVLLASPAAGAHLALPATPVEAAAPPEGCAQDAPGVQVCDWWFNTTEGPSDIGRLFDIELPARSLVTLTVVLDGVDNGWLYRFLEGEAADARVLSTTRHEVAPESTDRHAVESDTHLLIADPAAPHALVFFYHANAATVGYLDAFRSFAPTTGTFHVVAVIEEVPDGTPPARPAATRDDPHIVDLERDAARPEVDILAAWLDDRALGDGLFDAYVAVESLEHIEFNDTVDNLVAVIYTIWRMEFVVLGVEYEIWWSAYDNGTSAPETLCRLYSGDQLLMSPACDWDVANGTLHALVPERAVGNPGEGTLFTINEVWTDHGQDVNTYVTEDTAVTQRYPFALGGPAVWSGLNPRLDPPVTTSAWYDEPLASENLPNTLQVLGAIAAVITTLFGAFVVWRTRRQTRELLRRVDVLVERTDANTRAALLALGELERDFTRLYHDGRINETQYQVATQRVVSAASRLALRKELGLDDGAPDADATRVPVDVRRSP